MSVSADSRYATGGFVRVSLPDGTQSRALWPSRVKTAGIQYKNYTVKAGDRLDLIALREYQDPSKWWMIADMNPDIMWPHDLIDGSVIRIPLGEAPNEDTNTERSKMFVTDI